MTQKAGYVALIGMPNAGKSTLTNALVGEKVSIVSRKVQTTRAQMIGIFIHDTAQVVLIDTPGIFQPQKKLDAAMVQAAWQGVTDADIVALLIDVKKFKDSNQQALIDGLKQRKPKKTICLLNKVDLIQRDQLLSMADELNKLELFDAIFMISALKSDGLEALKKYCHDNLPSSPWHFPEEQISTVPQRLMAAEMTREKVYHFLHKELPYTSTVETEQWQMQDDGKLHINQVIYVQRPSQKAIVLGKQGSMIKKIGTASRKELQELFDQPIHLQLFVKVRENWMNDPERFTQMGLDFISGKE